MVSRQILGIFLLASGLLSAQTPRVLPPAELGDLDMARKMYREAIDQYREALKHSPPNSALVWDKIGIAYHELGDLPDARKSYERAIKLDHKYPDAINNVGTVYYAQKKYRTAIARYRKALLYAPNSASIWSNLGTAWYARGKFDEMAMCYAKALEIDPNIFEVHGSAGTQMLDRGVTDKARYHYELARIYAGKGDKDLALQYLRKSLEEGFKDKKKLNDDPKFATLRDTKEFKDLIALEPRVL